MPINKKAPVKKVNTRTKSRVGSSSLAKSSKSSLFTKRNGLIVAALATVAGLALVAFSFASTTPDGQYSYSTTCASTSADATTNTTGTTDSTSCIAKSAEALAFRLYTGAKGVDAAPDAATYASLTQKLAGDRIQPNVLAKDLLSPTGDNDAFIASLYKNILHRDPDPNGKKYWQNKLSATNPKKWSRYRVLATFATSKEAKSSKNSTYFQNFLTDAKPAAVAVTPTALQAQQARYAQMVKYAKAVKGVKKFKDAAAAAEKSKDAAAADAALKSAKDAYASNKANRKAARKVYDEARSLALYATDLKEQPAGTKKPYAWSKIVSQYNKVKAGETAGKSAVAAINKSVANIAAAPASGGGLTATTSSGGPTPVPEKPAVPEKGVGYDSRKCGIPIAQITQSSGPDCAARAQEWGKANVNNKIGVDGKWGPQTAAIVAYKAGGLLAYKSYTWCRNLPGGNYWDFDYHAKSRNSPHGSRDQRLVTCGSGVFAGYVTKVEGWRTGARYLFKSDKGYNGGRAAHNVGLFPLNTSDVDHNEPLSSTYSMCKNHSAGKYYDYHYHKDGSDYYRDKREVTCGSGVNAGQELSVGGWQLKSYKFKKKASYDSAKAAKEYGLYDKH